MHSTGIVLVAAGFCISSCVQSEEPNLALLARISVSDAMDGAHDGWRVVDGVPTTTWTAWPYHVPRDRRTVWLALEFWREMQIASVEITWGTRPERVWFAMRADGDWQPVNVTEDYALGRSRLAWDTPQPLAGLRIETPRDDRFRGILVGEIRITGSVGDRAEVFGDTLPSPIPLQPGSGELPVSFSQEDGIIDIVPVPTAEIARIEVDWSRPARRSVLEVSLADGRTLLFAAPRFRTVYDLPQAHVVSQLRVVALLASSKEGAQADRVRVLGPSGQRPETAPALEIWPETSLLKVRRGDGGPSDSSAAARTGRLAIALARNEYEAGQVVLRNPSDTVSVRQVTVAIGDLLGKEGYRLPSEAITWNPLGYVNGQYTDVLLPAAAFDVPPASCRPVWITVHAPADQPPGTYHGDVEIRQPGQPPRRIPFQVTVWPVTLPVRTAVETTYFSIWGIEGLLGDVLRDAQRRAMLAREIAENYARHRVYAGLHPFAQDREAILAEAERGNFTPFNEWLSFWQERGIPVEIGVPWSNTPEGIERCRFWARELAARQLDGAVVVSDEPRGRVDSVLEACELLNREVPYLRPKCAFKSCPAGYEFSYVGYIREWGYQPRAWCEDGFNFMVRFNREREALGEKVFWYIHTFINMDQAAYLHRMYFWALWKAQVRGTMLYSTCEWDYGGADRCLDEYVFDNDGAAGTLLWPGDGRFLESVRWELIRDGIEDYDLHKVLQERLATFVAAQPASPLVAEASAALWETDSVFRAVDKESEAEGYPLRMHAGGTPIWVALHRPEDLFAVRARIVDQIVRLEQALAALR